MQGVGFRWWTREQAEELGLAGSARNQPDGTVEVVAEGPREALEALLDRLRGSVAGRPGSVEDVQADWNTAPPGQTGFSVR